MESEEALKYFINEVTDSPDAVVCGEERILNEVEQAAEFLNRAGLSDLSKLYQEGKEIPDRLIKDSLSYRRLTQKQAETIKSRIRTLNKTVKNRQPRRKRQDIREVAWRIEVANPSARSRSADSLNSTSDTPNEDFTSDEDFLHVPPIILWPNHSSNSFSDFSSCPKISLLKLCTRMSKRHVLIPFCVPCARLGKNNSRKSQTERIAGNMAYSPLGPSNQKTKSKNLKGPVSREKKKFGINKERSSDVANLGSENVVLKGYHILNENGTLFMRERSGSDPTRNLQPSIECEPLISCTTVENGQQDMVSFEEMVKERLEGISNDKGIEKMNCDDNLGETVIHVEDLSDEFYQFLQPILYVELIAILDQYNIAYLKRKSSNKIKGGNVFGVNLSSLIMRDMTGDSTMIPEIFLSIISELNDRVTEDGILRIASQKQKLEALCNEIELNYYSNKSIVDNLLKEATVHELTGVLKRLLRDLPDPIFTVELCDMFFKTSLITDANDKLKALNLLVLLLPVQHRRTFKTLLDFLLNVAKHEKFNRMNLHNVAMITAPSFFPPRFLLPKDNKINIREMTREELVKQINGAAVCCSIMETLLQAGDKLWIVPEALARQAMEAQKRAHLKKEMPGKMKLLRNSTHYDASTKNTPKVKKY